MAGGGLGSSSVLVLDISAVQRVLTRTHGVSAAARAPAGPPRGMGATASSGRRTPAFWRPAQLVARVRARELLFCMIGMTWLLLRSRIYRSSCSTSYRSSCTCYRLNRYLG